VEVHHLVIPFEMKLPTKLKPAAEPSAAIKSPYAP
jgi:hypothetical protein